MRGIRSCFREGSFISYEWVEDDGERAYGMPLMRWDVWMMFFCLICDAGKLMGARCTVRRRLRSMGTPFEQYYARPGSSPAADLCSSPISHPSISLKLDQAFTLRRHLISFSKLPRGTRRCDLPLHRHNRRQWGSQIMSLDINVQRFAVPVDGA